MDLSHVVAAGVGFAVPLAVWGLGKLVRKTDNKIDDAAYELFAQAAQDPENLRKLVEFLTRLVRK